MGDLLLRGRRILEPGRCGHLWIHDQSADRALLYARTQYYGGPCPRGALWRLWHARVGLMLFCLRAMKPELRWKDGWIRFAFWAINIGMLLEIMLSLLPIGLLQT